MMDSVQAVKKRLETLIARISAIRKLSDAPADFEHASELFAELKEHLREEYRRMNTVKGQANLTDAEQRWYRPTVHEALAKFISPARPQQREKWKELLAEAEGEFSWSLSNLKSSSDKT